MPTLRAPIPNSEYTVSREAIMSVVHDLKRYTYMGDDVQVLFPNSSGLVPTKGSTIDDKNKAAAYLTTKILHLEVEEDTDPDFMLNVHVRSGNNSPIFADPEHKIIMTPVYFRQNVTLTVKFRSDSRSEVINWRNGIKTRLADGAQFGLLHTLHFNFHIPSVFQNLIKDVYDIRENNVPTGETFPQYFKRCSSDRITSIHDPHGAFQSLTVQESQSRVLGIYDLTDIPEKAAKDDDNGTWTCTLTYKFHYMKPEYMFIRYPVIVYGELLPEKYVEHQNFENDYRHRPQSANSNVATFTKFEYQNQLPRAKDAIGYVRYPYYDDIEIKNTFLGYKTVGSFLVGIGDDKRTLLNLKELGDFAISASVMEFIEKGEWRYIGTPYKSMIVVWLLRNDEIVSYENITITEDLDVKCNFDLSIKDEHRVIVDVVWDWQTLNRDIIERTLNSPNAFAVILEGINKVIKNLVDLTMYRDVNHGDIYKAGYEKDDFDIAIAILAQRVNDTYFRNNPHLTDKAQKSLDRILDGFINDPYNGEDSVLKYTPAYIPSYNRGRDKNFNTIEQSKKVKERQRLLEVILKKAVNTFTVYQGSIITTKK